MLAVSFNMRDLWHFLELLFIFGDLGLKIPANAEMIPKKMPELPSDLIYDAESHKFKLLPSREEMAERLTDGSERQKAIFFQLYDSALGEFDVKGYKWLMDSGGFRWLRCSAKESQVEQVLFQ